ncbi:MAG TPA: branched-chain amino acid ABC transporter permease [Desulfomonilaceae bacterium]|nr:branched-chain amino acid ABC transporter permease [Desulfomonilaceae bacterium]
MSRNLKMILVGIGVALLVYLLFRAISHDAKLFAQLFITGIMLGSIFALVALGWVLIYKCSGVLNLAMGELTMIGGYICLAFYSWFVTTMPIVQGFLFSLACTLVVGLVLGLLTERIFLRKMIGEPILAVIMVTVGLSFFFKGLVFIIWDTDTQVFMPRIFPIEPLEVFGIAIGQVYIWGFVAAMILMAVFVSFFKFTRWGLSMQACADDEMAALSLGVSAKFVYALAWAIAFMAAGVGGTLLGNINGLNYSVSGLGLLVLPVVVFGGLNSVPGAIVGGITIGILQNLAGGYLDYYFPGGIKEIAPFIFMVIFLLFKPFGLWGWERIERV